MYTVPNAFAINDNAVLEVKVKQMQLTLTNDSSAFVAIIEPEIPDSICRVAELRYTQKGNKFHFKALRIRYRRDSSFYTIHYGLNTVLVTQLIYNDSQWINRGNSVFFGNNTMEFKLKFKEQSFGDFHSCPKRFNMNLRPLENQLYRLVKIRFSNCTPLK